jgi:hypothetical protein
MMPTDRLTIFSTTFDSRANENTAAAVILATPAIVVASRMEVRTGSMMLPLHANRAFYRPAAFCANFALPVPRGMTMIVEQTAVFCQSQLTKIG